MWCVSGPAALAAVSGLAGSSIVGCWRGIDCADADVSVIVQLVIVEQTFT